MLTVGSLFAGIGGFDLGFERAGMRTLWQVEQSEFCRRVLERHFPDAQRFKDVRHVTGCVRRWEQEGGTLLEYVDVLCGGFPCQDLSYAGKGAGLEGERSGLWSEYARLIRELRPRYVVVENVSALLARGLGRVLGDLAACGYDAEWDCIPASAVGAPHRRDRIWLVAYSSGDDGRSRGPGRPAPGGSGEPEPIRALQDPDADRGRQQERGERHGGPVGPGQPAPQRSDADGLRKAVADASGTGREAQPGERGEPRSVRAAGTASACGSPSLADSERARLQGRTGSGCASSGRTSVESSGVREGFGGQWLTEPNVGRVAHGVPNRVDRLSALGNALVPQIAELIGRRIIEAEGGIAA